MVPASRGAWDTLGALPCPREEAVKKKRIPQNLCAKPKDANTFLVTEEAPRCLDSFALKWLKEKQKRGADHASRRTSTVGSLENKESLKGKARTWPNMQKQRAWSQEVPAQHGWQQAERSTSLSSQPKLAR